MAYSEGQLDGAQDYKVGLTINYSGVQNATQSRFDWSVRIVGTWGSWTNSTCSWSASIGGNGYSGTFTLPSGWSSPRTISSGSTYISHDSNGYRPGFASNAYMSVPHSNVGSGGSGDAWVDAPRIPQLSDAPHSDAISNITATGFRHTFSGSGVDTGGGTFVRWESQRATNSAFTTGVVTTTSSGTTDYTGLANHTTYWVRSRAVTSVGNGAWSGGTSGATLGHPTVPQSVAATPSTNDTGTIALTWSAPATTGAGGIVGYNIFRNGTQIATTTGTGTGYTDTGRTPYTSYAYTIAARNAYSTSVSATGPESAAVNAIAPGPPGAPTSLTGVSDGLVPGKVDLSWTAPANVGAGGITGYRVRQADGTLVVNQNGTGTSYSVTGLTPGVTYTFKVSARNALSDAEGSEGAFSNQVVVTPIGEPAAPTSLTVTPSAVVSNRLTLTWAAPAGVLSGYAIFQQVNSTGPFVLVQKVSNSFTSFSIDDQPTGVPQVFHVRARTSYTDTLATGYPGNWGGPASANVTGTASINNAQSVPGLAAVTSVTNAAFNGTFVINQATANTLGYAKVAGNVPSTVSGGTITNATNAVFNGTYTIATPTANTITYSKTNANIGLLSTTGGVVTDLTNQAFNGTFIVTAVNVGANTLSYANTAANFTAAAVPPNSAPGQYGSVVNLSNAIFNGTGKTITAITEFTFSYAQTNANVAESNAAGVVVDFTNQDVFNGTQTITSIPAYNVVQYVKVRPDILLRTWISPNGEVSRNLSPALLDVRFRSGWSG